MHHYVVVVNKTTQPNKGLIWKIKIKLEQQECVVQECLSQWGRINWQRVGWLESAYQIEMISRHKILPRQAKLIIDSMIDKLTD